MYHVHRRSYPRAFPTPGDPPLRGRRVSFLCGHPALVPSPSSLALHLLVSCLSSFVDLLAGDQQSLAGFSSVVACTRKRPDLPWRTCQLTVRVDFTQYDTQAFYE